MNKYDEIQVIGGIEDNRLNDCNVVGNLSFGRDGKSLEFKWKGTELGIRKEGDYYYDYVDLKGDGSDIEITKDIILDALGYEPVKQEELSNIKEDVKYIKLHDTKQDNELNFIKETINEVNLNINGVELSISKLFNSKANKDEVNAELKQLQEQLDNLDIPEGVDLKPIQADISKLYNTKADKDELPTKLSELNNDTNFITIEEVPKVDLSDIKKDIVNLESTKANKVDVKKDIEQLHNIKADRVELPTKLSDLQNDTGYITAEEIDLTEIENNLTELEDRCTALELEKSDIVYVDNEIKKVRDLIDGIDIPEDVDLRPILKRIEELEEHIDIELTKKVDKVEYISDIREIQDRLGSHGLSITELNGEVIVINSELAKKVDKTYVDGKLNDYYTKTDVYNKEEVNKRIAEIIGNAPENLDTLEKLAEALDNDDNFASSITKELTNKVDKEYGKGLSSNDFTDSHKSKLDKIEDGANRIEALSELTNDMGYITLADIPKVDLTEIELELIRLDKEVKTKANKEHEHTIYDVSGLSSWLGELEHNKADKGEVSTQITDLQEQINSIDVPEGVDLRPVYKELEKLSDTKADKKDIPTKLSDMIDDLIKVDSINKQTGDVELDAYNVPVNSNNPTWKINDELNRKASTYELKELSDELNILKSDLESLDIPETKPLEDAISSLQISIRNLQNNKADKTELSFEVSRIEEELENFFTKSEVLSKTGNLNNLTTTNKETLVDAINEVNSKPSGSGNNGKVQPRVTEDYDENEIHIHTVDKPEFTVGVTSITNDVTQDGNRFTVKHKEGYSKIELLITSGKGDISLDFLKAAGYYSYTIYFVDKNKYDSGWIKDIDIFTHSVKEGDRISVSTGDNLIFQYVEPKSISEKTVYFEGQPINKKYDDTDIKKDILNVRNDMRLKADKSELPTKLSELENDLDLSSDSGVKIFTQSKSPSNINNGDQWHKIID